MWIVERMARYSAERAALAELEANESWLENVAWRFEGGAVAIDADLIVGADRRSVTLTYPSIFPFAPPTVRPRGDATRWSPHQYGPGGELCLQHRPDNWEPSITGADMLRSAWTLLATEGGAANVSGEPMPVASDHRVSLGQALRSETWRLVLTASVMEKIASCAATTPLRLRFEFVGTALIAFVAQVVDAPDAIWLDPELPGPLHKDHTHGGFTTALSLEDARWAKIDETVSKGASALRSLVVDGADFDKSETLIFSTPGGLRAFYVVPSADSVSEYALVLPDPAVRSAEKNAALASKKVAVVGAGSIGSKVAVSLARAGISDFLLVDDDVLTPENMARHDLDWRSVGAHKVDALSERLNLLCPGMVVKVRRQRLGGQESSGSLEGVLTAISQCDLIVDATGSHDGFNYCGSVAHARKKPMAWASVFAGGYGGLIARSRPGLDPAPLDARASIEAWCANPDFPAAPKAATNYGGLREDGVAMVADDADVGVIAAQLARLALDTLTNSGETDFEHSAYMIGLRKEWIFKAAFDTWPVELGGPLPEADPSMSEMEKEAAVASILAMFERTT